MTFLTLLFAIFTSDERGTVSSRQFRIGILPIDQRDCFQLSAKVAITGYDSDPLMTCHTSLPPIATSIVFRISVYGMPCCEAADRDGENVIASILVCGSRDTFWVPGTVFIKSRILLPYSSSISRSSPKILTTRGARTHDIISSTRCVIGCPILKMAFFSNSVMILLIS